MNQKRTVQYTIREEGFCYHTKKGILKSGSTISKKEHPLKEVETMKQRLVQNGLLVDAGNYYKVKHGISTGFLMAYNMHCGYLVKKIPQYVMTIIERVGEETSIKQAFWFKNLRSADNEFLNRLDKDAFRIIKIMRADYKAEFFKGTQKIGISKEEQFVANVLIAVGEISSYRRGNAKDQEADLIDEENNRQIEIVRFLDEKIPDQVRYKRAGNQELSLLAEYVDMNYNKVPEGVLKKFTEKDYTDRYSKELAIYMLGSQERAIEKIQKLREELNNRIHFVKNNFAKIHFIIHDPFIEQSITYCSRDLLKIISDREWGTDLIILETADNNIAPDQSYFIVRENIFTGDKDLTLMIGSDINKYGLLN